MLIAAYLTFIVFCIAGLFWSLFSGMGTLLVFLGAVFIGLATDFQAINVSILAILLILFLAGELLEYLLVLVGARSFGATRKAAWGSLAGGVLGFAFGFFGTLGIGIVPLTILGIFTGGFCVELADRRGVKQAIKSGAGGIFGRLGAIVTKVLITSVMIALVFWAVSTGPASPF